MTFKNHLQNRLSIELQDSLNGKHGAKLPSIVAILTDKHNNIFTYALGKLHIYKDECIQLNSILRIFSATKILTGTLAFIFIEQGRLSLHDFAKTYIKEIADIEVLIGFDSNGKPITRKPKRDITINDLLLHTSGFGYEFFDKADAQYRSYYKIPSITTNTHESIKSILLNDPGYTWRYGISIDWLGKILECIAGDKLSNLMRDFIFIPCDMHDSSFDINKDQNNRLAIIHTRESNGDLIPMPSIRLPRISNMDMGGHGLHCSMLDFMKFMRVILNNGKATHGRILQKKTLDFMCKGALKGIKSYGFESAMSNFANAGEFYPDIEKNWGYTFQINETKTNTQRDANTIMWAGLANLYYFIDRINGISGCLSTQTLPFFDKASYDSYLAFERIIYENLIR